MNQPIRLTNFDKARAQMLIKHPFFASIVLSTDWVVDKKISTAMTNMVKVWYNPDFYETLTVDVAIFVNVHEIMHIILKHGLRRGNRKPIRWNKACDYAINQELKDADITLWDHCLIDHKYKGMTAEQIYDLLTLEREGKGKRKGKGKPGQGEPADGAGGGQPDDDDDIEDLGPLGQDVTDATEGKSQQEVSDISDGINQKVAQAATMARAAGKLPANLQLLVDGELNPPQPWELILREFMTRVVNETETWNRRNRRFANITLPSRYSVGMGELIIIGDTSGSMIGDKVFGQIAHEINHCNEYVKPERTRVVWADAEECSGEQVFEPGEEVKLEPKGGGGTDMRLPLKFVEKWDPCCVILVTDCYTPWPDVPCPFPLIVCSITDAPSPDWAMRLKLR